MESFDQSQIPGGIWRPEKKMDRFARKARARMIASPVSCDQIEPAVVVEIADRHAVPPTAELAEERGAWRRVRETPGHRRIPSPKFAVVVLKNSQRVPFASEDQIGPA